jgi:hypothetical protein
MPKRPDGAGKRPGWQAGRLPRMPAAAPGEEPDWVTGLLHERLLDGLLEDQAGDQDRPEHGAGQLGRSGEQWATGSPAQSQHSATSADLPDYEAECDDPPDRERV